MYIKYKIKKTDSHHHDESQLHRIICCMDKLYTSHIIIYVIKVNSKIYIIKYILFSVSRSI